MSATGTLVYSPSTGSTVSRLVWMDRTKRVLSSLADEADYSNIGLSRDGTRLATSVLDPAKDTLDIWIVDTVRGVRQRLTFDPSDERSAAWSPDGRSIVPASGESGQAEVYVLSLEPGGGKSRISTAGGTFPRWRRDGKEIVYLGLDQQITVVPVTGTGRSFKAGSAQTLFPVVVQPGPGTPFDLTPDGQRFIVNAAIPSKTPPSLTLVVNWPALMKTR